MSGTVAPSLSEAEIDRLAGSGESAFPDLLM